ncbi:CASP-like protein [Rhynchospora pubera]|uniref:CASP-like protein n=1 Tax=Rhynchospora pubera TaxID=906938 RepID=A0AAV8FR77_9POAL|nr:CASP-like protein [Rhynchospora pubera]
MAVYIEGKKLKAMERKVKVGEVALRFATLVLGVSAAALMETNSEVKGIVSIQTKAKFTDMKILVFLVIANGLAAAYSLVQLVRCLTCMLHGTMLHSKAIAWAIFISDQVMAYITLAAIAATAQAAVFAEYGQPEFQWMKACNIFTRFCFQSGEGATMALLVSMASICLSGISAFNLFRLYDCSFI